MRQTIDLVKHAPGVSDVEEAILGERGGFVELITGAAAERHRISELQSLDVVAIDARERREALAIIGAMVHQPVLRLLVGIDEPLGRDVGRQGWQRDGCGAGNEGEDDRGFVCHCCFPHAWFCSVVIV
jgi:hypothetical protein